MDVLGVRYTSREAAGTALLKAKFQPQGVVIGHYGGFSLTYQKNYTDRRQHLTLTGQSSHMANYDKSALGAVGVLDFAISQMEDEVDGMINVISRVKARLHDIQSSSTAVFEHDTRINELLTRQREIEDALDLMKGDHGAVDDSAEAA